MHFVNKDHFKATVLIAGVLGFLLGLLITAIGMSMEKEEISELQAKQKVCDNENANFEHSSFHRFTEGVLVKKKSNKFMITIVCEDKK